MPNPAPYLDRPSATARPRMIAMANQKGGVGKTTTAINLGTALAAVGEPVLILDLDPQGNASTGLGIGRERRKVTSYDLLRGEVTLADAIIDTAIPNLSIIPATVDLSGMEFELAPDSRRSYRLRSAYETFIAEGKRDIRYVLIDCPPSLNVLTINALVAADSVLVPLQCEFFALEGLSQLLRTIDRVKTSLNPRLEIEGVVLTMFDRRNSLSEQVAGDVRSVLGKKVYETVIPRNVRVSEAPSHGKPALVYDHRCAGSKAYMKLAGEILQRRLRAVAA